MWGERRKERGGKRKPTTVANLRCGEKRGNNQKKRGIRQGAGVGGIGGQEGGGDRKKKSLLLVGTASAGNQEGREGGLIGEDQKGKGERGKEKNH